MIEYCVTRQDPHHSVIQYLKVEDYGYSWSYSTKILRTTFTTADKAKEHKVNYERINPTVKVFVGQLETTLRIL